MRYKLKDVRQSFMQYWKAERFPNSDDPAKYFSGTFILPPDHPQLEELEAICLGMCKEKWPGKVTQKNGKVVSKGKIVLNAIKRTGKIFLRSGDDKPEYEDFPGNFFISARSKVQPTFFTQNKQPITEEDGLLYSGCFVNVNLELYPYTKGNNGLGARIRGVQLVRKGEAFGGGGPPSDEDDFDEVEMEDDDDPDTDSDDDEDEEEAPRAKKSKGKPKDPLFG